MFPMLFSLTASLTRLSRACGLVFLSVLWSSAWVHAADMVGETKGAMQVGPAGAMEYQIPLRVPAGVNGLEPPLSLVYRSTSPNGLLGLGWSLSGLSSIHRCANTWATDGKTQQVMLSFSDQLCLDGQRLMLISGSHWGVNAEYRTQIESFQRVKILSTNPMVFEVRKKSGEILQYGGTVDSRIKALGKTAEYVWAVNQVSDRFGNKITIQYAQDPVNGDFYPIQLHYANAKITLSYTANRTDAVSRYFAGAKVKTVHALSQVTMWLQDKKLREYTLSYSYGSNVKQLQLTSITECGYDEVGQSKKCLAPTQVQWINQLSQWGNAQNGLAAKHPDLMDTFPLDWNGDGKMDLYTSQLKLAGRISISQGTTFTNQDILPMTEQNWIWSASPIDADSDGKHEVLYREVYRTAPDSTTFEHRWAIYRSNGQKVYLNDKWIVDTKLIENNTYVNLELVSSYTSPRAIIAELDGDGLLDIVLPVNKEWRIYRNISSNGTIAYQYKGNVIGLSPKTHPVGEAIDVDGDGRHELVFKKAGDNYYYVTACNPDATPKMGLTTLASGAILSNKAVSLDANGDGLVDFVMPKAVNGVERLHLFINKGDATFTTINTNIATTGIFVDVVQPYTSRTYVVKPLDYNGDGLMDLVYIGATKFTVILSTGENFAAPLQTTISANASLTQGYYSEEQANALKLMIEQLKKIANLPNQTPANKQALMNLVTALEAQLSAMTITRGMNDFQIMDINGDAQLDLIQVNATKDGWQVHTQLRTTPALAQQVTSGQGLTSRVVYAPTTNASVYTKGTGAKFPEVDIVGPFFVVAQSYQSNGIGGENQRSYRYKQARWHLQGRGFLGMQEYTDTDVAKSIATTTTFQQSFPYTGLPYSQTITVGNVPIASQQSVWQATAMNANKNTFVAIKQQLQSEMELNGTLVSATRVDSTYDGYGNLDVQVITRGKSLLGDQVSGIEQTVTEDPSFINDPVNWLIGFKTQHKVTYAVPNESNRTVIADYVAVPGTLAIASETQFPNDPNLQLTKQYTRDAQGNLLSVNTTGAKIQARTEQSTDYVLNRYPQTILNALNHQTTKTYDLRFGQPRTITDPNGLLTLLTYDEAGRLIHSEAADGTETQVTYSACVNCPPLAVYQVTTEVTHANEVGAGTPKRIEYRDALDRVIREETIALNGQKILVDTHYDALGRIAKKSTPYIEGNPIYWTTYQFDAMDRQLLSVQPDNGKQQMQYTGNNQVGGREVTITTTVIQPNATQSQQVVTQSYNPINQLIKTKDAVGTITEFDYDAQGNLDWSRVAGDNKTLTTLLFDLAGNKLSITDTDTGTTTFTYNAVNKVLSEKNAIGDTKTYVYDLLDRVITNDAVYPKPGVNEHHEWVYDQGNQGIGQLSQVTKNNFKESYQYDNLSRLVQRKTEIQGDYPATYNFAYTYDGFSRLKTLTYPSGFAVKQIYNTLGYLSQVVDAGNNTVYQTITQQDALGHITEEKYANGLTTQRTYNPQSGRVQSLKTLNGNQVALQSVAYQLDTLGNLTQRKDLLVGATEDFTYDSINRLLQAKTTWQNNNPSRTLNYSYDVLGNIKTKTGPSAVALGNYVYGGVGAHQVTTAGNKNYSYDAAGQMQVGAGRNYSYLDNVVLIDDTNTQTKSHFRYRPDGSRYYQRIEKNGAINYTLYSGDGLFEEHFDVNKNLLEQKSYVGNFLIHTINSNNQVTKHYLHRDHLDSVDTITDEQGNVTAKTEFDPFGFRRAEDWQEGGQASTVTQRGFTDHEHLDGVGLIHMNGRVYDPALGRFLSADPFVQMPTFSQSFNRYSYVWNNPLSGTDPSGYMTELDDYYLGNNSNLFYSLNQIYIKDLVPNSLFNTAIDISIALNNGIFSSHANSALNAIPLTWNGSLLPNSGTNFALEIDFKKLSIGGSKLFGALVSALTPDNLFERYWESNGSIIYSNGAFQVTASEEEIKNALMNAVSILAASQGKELYGPFHRRESPTQTKEVSILQTISQEIWGGMRRNFGAGALMPTVNAHTGPLPTEYLGIEFVTTIRPHPNTLPGYAYWYETDPGVMKRGDYVAIPVILYKNTQIFGN